jgi:cbb3-type cytochrome oxidase subunit 3
MQWQEWCLTLMVLVLFGVCVWVWQHEKAVRKEEARRKPIGWDVFKSQIFM